MTIQLINILFVLKLNYNLIFILTLIKTQLQINFIFKEIKIHQNQDLIVTNFIKNKLFILNLSLVTNNIAFRVKSVKLTKLVKLMSILTNLFNLTKSLMKLESSTHNNKLTYN